MEIRVNKKEGSSLPPSFCKNKANAMYKKTPLIKQLGKNAKAIENWLKKQWKDHIPPFYCSADLRYSGHKLTPVDNNLFPAGFNLILDHNHTFCVHALKKQFSRLGLKPKRLMIIPENHTRNIGYQENIAALANMIEKAGIEVQIGTLIKEMKQAQSIKLPSGNIATLKPIKKIKNRLTVEGFDPEFILLNHDLSDGVPDLLRNLEQPLLPPLKAGWSNRRKSHYFQEYQKNIEAFAKTFEIDPWLMLPLFDVCEEVYIQEHKGEEAIAEKSQALLKKIQEKYKEYDIQETPFLMIKSDSGTYGMGILKIEKPEDIFHLNRRQRDHMLKGKGGIPIHQVIIQEGVHTIETMLSEKNEEKAAEAMVYMLGDEVIGGSYRIHPKRQHNENLNSPGMYFDSEKFLTLEKTDPEKYYAYTVLARLSALAAAKEIETLDF
jgi:glutamate--cysteine ligase